MNEEKSDKMSKLRSVVSITLFIVLLSGVGYMTVNFIVLLLQKLA